jgi:hypothetical protein
VLTIEGSDALKMQAVAVAVREGIHVRFADPYLEKYRLALIEQQKATTAARPTERPSSTPKSTPAQAPAMAAKPIKSAELVELARQANSGKLGTLPPELAAMLDDVSLTIGRESS